MKRRSLFYLREYFFPRGCACCGQALLSAEDAYFGLCLACRAFLEKALVSEARCAVCGKPLISEKETCLECRGRSSYSDSIIKIYSIFPYTGKFKSVLGAYKFGKSLGVANFLAACYCRVISEFKEEGAAFVPVPPRPGKMKRTGWDQVEYLAQILGRKNNRFPVAGLPVCRCLKRLPSRSQKELNREERGSNLKGRILCSRPPPKTALIFDDVITTGATLNSCAQALLEGGAGSVYGVCLFYD